MVKGEKKSGRDNLDSLCRADIAILLKQENNFVDSLGDGDLAEIDGKVGISRDFVRIIDTSESLDFTLLCTLIDTIVIALNADFKGSRNVDKVETTKLFNGLAGILASFIVRGNGRNDSCSAGASQFTSNECLTGNVDITIALGEPEFGGKFLTDILTHKEGYRARTFLVERDLQGTGQGVLSGGMETGQENGETLLGARRVGLAKNADNFWVREPFGDGQASAQTTTELSTANVQSLDALGDFVSRHVFIGVRAVCDHLKRYDLDTDFFLVLFNKLLSIVRAVKVDTLGVLARAGVITTNNKVSNTVVFADQRVPDSLTRSTHTHSQGKQAELSHTVGILGHQGLVDANTSVVVDVSGLGETNNGVDQQVSLASTGSTDGQFTVSTVHRVTSLESDDASPLQFLEVGTQFAGSNYKWVITSDPETSSRHTHDIYVHLLAT